ncbi:uncharacterized protein HMPREF1541_08114 [Cyphellophora europaea CBS 101466]|uniref:PEP phosphonomutase n=1 Tax=Cyphellophora europaea (strain CBS 101466) TaxID=1220924 RepID=W2RN05_CYPE1|nr:uncharacterized protein HMPREF1541_08114 [Cyphellophora europaea CBS 101466]ETN37124.1 hypothetical protein HMPREF1541_08114 [Cyphellophora europaea CBS 101466]
MSTQKQQQQQQQQQQSDLPGLAARLKSLHQRGTPLLLTNVHDAGTAQLIARNPRTTALATASWAMAATQGVGDNDLTLAGNLAGIANVAAGLRNSGRAAEVPLSADLQDGYADPAETVRAAVKLGVVGANIEDVDNSVSPPRLRGVEEQVARLREVMRGAREAGVDGFVLNARTDVFGYGGTVEDVIERGKKWLEAGATSVFVWGVGKKSITKEEVELMVKELGMVSVQPGDIGVKGAREAGACRISVGPMLYRKSLEHVEQETLKLMDA